MKPALGTKEYQERINKLKREIETLLNEDDYDAAAFMQIYLLKVMQGDK